MKKSDIKVGSEYAYNRSEYGSAQRVKVLGEAQIQQGWGYGRKYITGSEVQVLDSKTGKPAVRGNAQSGEEVPWIIKVANRTIREPWVDYAERNAAIAKSREEGARKLRADRSERAAFLLDLIPALRESGFFDNDSTVYDNEVVDALREHVEDCLDFKEEGIGRGWVFSAPLARHLAEFVKNGSAIPIPSNELLMVLQGRSIR